MLYSYHRGQYLQRGKGLGGIFSTLARWLKPIIPKLLSFGKKTLKDPQVNQAVQKIKREAVSAGSRAINKKLKSIAPSPKPKRIKKTSNVPPPAQNPITISKAKKRVANTMLKTNVIPKGKNKNIFDQMK